MTYAIDAELELEQFPSYIVVSKPTNDFAHFKLHASISGDEPPMKKVPDSALSLSQSPAESPAEVEREVFIRANSAK